MERALYPGTFDPMTLGHLDLVIRSARIFPRVIVAVAADSRKNVLFDLDDRVAMVQESVANLRNVTVEPFDGLLVDYARKRRVHVVIRGLRAYSDFEYEFQMALTNRKLAPDVETFFLMPNEVHSYVSSSTVKEIARLGGATREFVPEAVEVRLRQKMVSAGRGGRHDG